jgi:hypothetical protein
LFKGTQDQAQLVAEALKSLQPSQEAKVAASNRQVEEAMIRVRQLELGLDEAQRRRSRAEDELTDLRAELERMRIRMEEAEKRAGLGPQHPEKPKQP